MRAFYLSSKFEKSIRFRETLEFNSYKNKAIVFGGDIVVDNNKLIIYKGNNQISSIEPDWDDKDYIYSFLEKSVGEMKEIKDRN